MSDAETNFRSSFANWTNPRTAGVGTDPTASFLPNLSSWGDYMRDGANDIYTRLPSYNGQQTVEEPSWFKLSRMEKLVVFLCCLAGSILCFTFGFLLFPVLALKPRKFGLLWTLGSFLFVISFGALQGPMNFFVHITSKDRLPFSIMFFGSVVMTVYSALFLKSTILTIISSVFEVIAVLYYTVSYFPFGAQTLRMVSGYGAGYVGSMVGL